LPTRGWSLTAMRLPAAIVVTAGLLLPGATIAADDEAAALVARQKQSAEANCRALRLAPLATAENANLLLYGAAPEARLRTLAANLEKYYATAHKVLQFDPGDKPWTGKLTVYVFADRGQFRSFVRQIEK